jgi:hypothetical protein
LIGKIKAGIIKPVRLAYRNDGSMDPVRTVISVSDLAKLATARGEKRRYLRHLMVDQTVPTTREAPPSLGPPVDQTVATPARREAPRDRTKRIREELVNECILKRRHEQIKMQQLCDEVRRAAKKRGYPTDKGFSDKSIERTVKARLCALG